jgi:hypothetical protein
MSRKSYLFVVQTRANQKAKNRTMRVKTVSSEMVHSSAEAH